MKNAMQLKAIMKKLAKENQISAQLVLQNYMLERFLERVSLSPYRDNYIIKGGFLISSMVGLNSRATMDMDATIKGYPVTQDAVQKMIEQILTVPVDDDITFTFKSMQSADFLSAVFFYLKVGENLNQNWIVENLNNAFSTWNGKLGELWGLVTTGPQTFKGGAVWSVMQTLHNGMVGIGYALVVLFFAISLCKNTMNFHELKRPEAAIHYFLRFVAAKALVGYGMDIMLNVFSICNGIVTDMADSMGGISEAMVSLPAEMQTAIENVGFLASIPLWLVTILGSLFITVLSFVMIITVYGRFFRLYMYTALAPLPLAAFAGESTQSVGISFLKSYVGVCLEGAVIVLACVIYSAFVSTPTVASGEATTIVWSYLAETVFNMLVLVGLIKGSDRIIHEMMGL